MSSGAMKNCLWLQQYSSHFRGTKSNIDRVVAVYAKLIQQAIAAMKINYTRRIKENIFALMWRTRDEFQLAKNSKWAVETDTMQKPMYHIH